MFFWFNLPHFLQNILENAPIIYEDFENKCLLEVEKLQLYIMQFVKLDALSIN